MTLVNLSELSASELSGLEYTVGLRNREIDERNARLSEDDTPEDHWTVQEYADDRARAVFQDYFGQADLKDTEEKLELVKAIKESDDPEDKKLHDSLADRLLKEREKRERESEEAIEAEPIDKVEKDPKPVKK